MKSSACFSVKVSPFVPLIHFRPFLTSSSEKPYKFEYSLSEVIFLAILKPLVNSANTNGVTPVINVVATFSLHASFNILKKSL